MKLGFSTSHLYLYQVSLIKKVEVYEGTNTLIE